MGLRSGSRGAGPKEPDGDPLVRLAERHLTGRRWQTSLSDMATTTTTREFLRNFSRIKKAVANGDEVLVRDRQGQTFVFRAKGAGPSLGEQLADLRGALRSGRPVKTLDGFGRNRP